MCTQSGTSLNAATATGVGDTIDFGENRTVFTLVVDVTGSPTQTSVGLQLSLDGVSWYTPSPAVATSNTSGTGNASSTGRVARYARANLSVLTGGTSPTVTAAIGAA